LSLSLRSTHQKPSTYLSSPQYVLHATPISFLLILLPPYYLTNKTCLFTACSRDLSEKLTVPQLFEKLPAFYENRRFITAFTNVHHLSLS
jgi:hypothetical protein